MLSPAAQHRAKLAGTRKASLVRPEVLPQEVVMLKLFKSDRQRLASIRSRNRRTDAKQALLANYEAWIIGFMQQEGYTQEQSTMFVWLLLWRVDVGHWQGALEMAAFAIDEGLPAPLEFTRTLAEAVAEQITDGINRGGDHQANRPLLEALYTLVIDEDMTDQITAKINKACGLACMNTDKVRANTLFNKALRLNPHSGVKQLLKQLNQPASPTITPKLKNYGLSAREAAKLLGVSLPTVLRHARKYPQALPHSLIQMGSRTVYRFNKSDVKRYKTNHKVDKP